MAYIQDEHWFALAKFIKKKVDKEYPAESYSESVRAQARADILE